jgi:hypothetical protein
MLLTSLAPLSPATFTDRLRAPGAMPEDAPPSEVSWP